MKINFKKNKIKLNVKYVNLKQTSNYLNETMLRVDKTEWRQLKIVITELKERKV